MVCADIFKWISNLICVLTQSYPSVLETWSGRVAWQTILFVGDLTAPPCRDVLSDTHSNFSPGSARSPHERSLSTFFFLFLPFDPPTHRLAHSSASLATRFPFSLLARSLSRSFLLFDSFHNSPHSRIFSTLASSVLHGGPHMRGFEVLRLIRGVST